jgi:hypothetical protein
MRIKDKKVILDNTPEEIVLRVGATGKVEIWDAAEENLADLVCGTITGDLTGNAGTADRLSAPVNVSVSGAVAGSAQLDGSGDVDVETTARDFTVSISGGVIASGVVSDLGDVDLEAVLAAAGTTATSFQLGDGVKIRDNGGVLEVQSGDGTPASVKVNGLTATGNVLIDGNLTVNGDQFIVDVADLFIEDNVITLNRNEEGSGVSLGEAGIEVVRGSLENSVLLWLEGIGRWTCGTDTDRRTIVTEGGIVTLGGQVAGSGTFDGGGNLDIATVMSEPHDHSGEPGTGGALHHAGEYDPHEHYILKDGDKDFTDAIGCSGVPTDDKHLTTKWYVDETVAAAVSAHDHDDLYYQREEIDEMFAEVLMPPRYIVGTDFPVGPDPGWLFFKIDTKTLHVFDGGEWKQIAWA